jgi:hypothetical protein
MLISVWTVPVAIIPVSSFDLLFEGFPRSGSVIGITTWTPASGAGCLDWKVIDTGSSVADPLR